MLWAKGYIHHDDVLFFSWILINKYPFLLTILRAKFPYFFVNEFQDTNPIQVKIVQKIAEEETIVGVVGIKHSQFIHFRERIQRSLIPLPSLILASIK
jgi:DNA helicase-2/ATP-dependent DNA helicase PcrA